MNNDLGQTEQEILALSAAWSEAIVVNDTARIGEFMSDDWIIVSNHGIMTREQFLSLVGSGQLIHDSMDLAELAQVKIYGDTAVLASRVTSVANFGGQKFPANEWTSDVFIKTSGGWKCVMTHITPVLETLAT